MTRPAQMVSPARAVSAERTRWRCVLGGAAKAGQAKLTAKRRAIRHQRLATEAVMLRTFVWRTPTIWPQPQKPQTVGYEAGLVSGTATRPSRSLTSVALLPMRWRR